MSLRVGLTGGIASGKSTVGRLLREAGCLVTDADRLVAELYLPGAEGARRVGELFGGSVLDVGGGVDHGRLGALVFGDPEARRRLEAAIHPLVGERFAELAAGARGIVVFEATLLVETGGWKNFDRLVTVEADPELRVRRAIERGLPEAAARARLAAQATRDQRVARADFVIENRGSLEELQTAVDGLLESLQRLLEASDQG